MNSVHILGVLLLVATVFAGGSGGGQPQGFNNINNATNTVKGFLCNVLPLVVFIAVIFAALLYGISQVLPSEQKARVGQFAGAALVTGVLAAIVYVVGPAILGILDSKLNVSCQ